VDSGKKAGSTMADIGGLPNGYGQPRCFKNDELAVNYNTSQI